MINRFSQFLVEEESVVYFTFGRMNPPTIGHGKLLDTLASKARRAPYRIFLSQSNDKKKNPLQYKDKVKHVRKMFPKHARSIILNNKIKTPFDALTFLYDQGFRKVVLVAGSDRVTEYDVRLNKYNGVKSNHGFYNFEGGIKIISAGERDPDAEGAEGASGTKQRKLATDNDFTSFAQGLPSSMSNANAKRLFNDVRRGMGLKEEKQFKNHIQLEPVSDLREAYLRDNIFEEGEQVVLRKNGVVGNIQYLGTNYLIVESKGERWRCWLDDVDKVDPNFKVQYNIHDLPNDDNDGVVRESLTEGKSMYADKPDWGTPESTKKAKKSTPGQSEGLWDNIHAKRRRGDKMRKKGAKGAPTPDQIKRAQESTQDSDIKNRPGTQPARYHKGLERATKIARDRHFKKHGKKADNDSSAYKPAPGDANAKTKPSKYTKFVNRMMK